MIDNGNIAPTLETSPSIGRLEIDGHVVRCRRLTPRECFRLQGWTDDYFDKAEFVSSDSQLYRQAGNGVSVPVIEEIARRLTE